MEIFFLAIVFCPICLILTIFLHELGHAFFGLIRGGEFLFIIIGPIKYGRDNSSAQCRFEINKELQYYGGVVAVTPPVDASPKDYFYCLFGGPFISFLCVCLTLPVIFLTFKNVPMWFWFFILQFCLSSFAIAIGTLIPYPKRITNFSYSDGKRLFDYFKGEKFYQFDYYSWKNASSSLGVQSRVNREECEILKQSSDPVYQFFGAYYLLKDAESNREEEKRQLQQAFSQLPERQKQELLIIDEEIKQWINEPVS